MILGGIISLIEITSDKGIGICVHLVSAITQGVYLIMLTQIFDGICVKQPGADRTRIVAEDLLELAHSLIDEDLTFLYGISNAEAGVYKPIPLPTSLAVVRHTAGGCEGLNYLVPEAKLDILPCPFLNALDEFLVGDNVVLKKEGCGKPHLVDKIELIERGFCKQLLCFKIARLKRTRKIHNVYSFHKNLVYKYYT